MTTAIVNKKWLKLIIKFLTLLNQLKKTDFDAKITNIEGNSFTTADYKKFMSDIDKT